MIFASAIPDKKTRGADRRLRLDHVGRVPAPDQDADRAAGVLDAGRRHRAHGRRRLGRPRVRQGAGLVHHRVAGLAAARPDPGQPAAARATTSACRCPTSAPRPTWRPPSSRSRTSSATSCRSRSPRRWRTTRSCRSSCSRCSSAWRSPRSARRRRTLVAAIDELSHAMLKITGYVMKLAPIAVFAAMAATVAVNGLEILLQVRRLHGRLLPRPDPAVGAA